MPVKGHKNIAAALTAVEEAARSGSPLGGKAHEFLGRLDRPCERCGYPDRRHPVHRESHDGTHIIGRKVRLFGVASLDSTVVATLRGEDGRSLQMVIDPGDPIGDLFVVLAGRMAEMGKPERAVIELRLCPEFESLTGSCLPGGKRK